MFVALKKLKLFEGKIILSFHLSDVREALAAERRDRRLWRVLLRGADHIVVVSDDLAEDVLALDPTSAAKMTPIYNGSILLYLHACAPFSVPNQSKTIVSIGAFIPRKGHDVLVRAFGHVSRQVPDARLVLAASWRRWPRS